MFDFVAFSVILLLLDMPFTIVVSLGATYFFLFIVCHSGDGCCVVIVVILHHDDLGNSLHLNIKYAAVFNTLTKCHSECSKKRINEEKKKFCSHKMHKRAYFSLYFSHFFHFDLCLKFHKQLVPNAKTDLLYIQRTRAHWLRFPVFFYIVHFEINKIIDFFLSPIIFAFDFQIFLHRLLRCQNRNKYIWICSHPAPFKLHI